MLARACAKVPGWYRPLGAVEIQTSFNYTLTYYKATITSMEIASVGAGIAWLKFVPVFFPPKNGTPAALQILEEKKSKKRVYK